MTPTTNVIVLAQGRQTRLPGFVTPKQLLQLPAHAACDAPNRQIIGRTIAQVVRVLLGDGRTVKEALEAWENNHYIQVVGWQAMDHDMECGRVPYLKHRELETTVDLKVYADVVELAEPGNSSLVGLSRFLDSPHQTPVRLSGRRRPKAARTVVLLGDVVYSWACLEALFRDKPVTFAGTSNLGVESGELWGVAYRHDTVGVPIPASGVIRLSDVTPEREVIMPYTLPQRALQAALRAASKADDDVYQPGQLRHWLWAFESMSPDYGDREWWVPIDDYTMDVDLPEHLIDLARASLEAYADDKARGMVRGG